MLGIVYGVLSAASFGFNSASARRGVLTGTAIQGVAISMPLGLALFFLCAVVFGEWQQAGFLSRRDILLFCAAGFMSLIWGRYFSMRALAAVGSNISGPAQQSQLLVSLALAMVFLGETLTPLKILGIVLIAGAPMYVLHRRSRTRRAGDGANITATAPDETTMPSLARIKFTPRMAEGYLCAVLAGIGIGISPVLVKAGLENTGLSLMGGLVSYSAACAMTAILLVVPSQFAQVRSIDQQSLKWFAIAGTGVSFSQLFRYLALGVAPVTIVQPLQSLSLIFRMIFGYLINRDHEAFDSDTIIGILMSFLGVIALSLSL